MMALAVHTDELPVERLPDACHDITTWRVDLQAAALCEYYYPYSRIGIVHLAGQKAMRFDPAATVEVQDLAGGLHKLSLRYGSFQQMAAALAGRPGARLIQCRRAVRRSYDTRCVLSPAPPEWPDAHRIIAVKPDGTLPNAVL
jgi:hypothetical protein